MGTSLTKSEQEELRIQLNREIKEQHEAREKRYEDRRKQARGIAQDERAAARDVQIAKIRREEEMKFFKENGYQKYRDSRGRVQWLSVKEYDSKMRTRRRRRKSPIKKALQAVGLVKRPNREYRPGIMATPIWNFILYGGIMLAAVVVWLVLVMKGS